MKNDIEQKNQEQPKNFSRNTCTYKNNAVLLHRNQICNNYKPRKIMDSQVTLKYLTDHGVKPSVQRLAVMDYLLKHRTHPTVEDIYNDLHPTMPTLSKTTVYNTLRVLTEQGAALQLTIDEKKVCFDADTQPHAHFLCRKCGKVFDLRLHHKDLKQCVTVPEGFTIEQEDLYFRGICKHCAEKEEK